MLAYLCYGQGLEEVSRTEIGKKIKEGMEEAAKTAKTSAESVSKSGEMLGKTGAFRAISQVRTLTEGFIILLYPDLKLSGSNCHFS